MTQRLCAKASRRHPRFLVGILVQGFDHIGAGEVDCGEPAKRK
jgi:hypothetical protein